MTGMPEISLDAFLKPFGKDPRKGDACVAPTYKDATKMEKVKFGERVFRVEWMVRCGWSGGWGFGRFFIFLFGDGLVKVADRYKPHFQRNNRSP